MDQLTTTQLFWTTVFVLGVTAFVMMALGAFMGFSQARQAAAKPAGLAVHWVIIGVIALWFGFGVAFAATGLVSLNLVLLMTVIPVTGGLLLSFTGPIKRALREVKTHWLVMLQVYRVVGFAFIFPYLTEGLLVREFALNAGIGDVLTGILAVPVALALANNHSHKRLLFYGWTAFGILDLLVAMGSAALFGFATGNTSGFPITLLPIFLGPPLSILLHLLTIRNFQLAAPNANSWPRADVVRPSG